MLCDLPQHSRGTLAHTPSKVLPPCTVCVPFVSVTPAAYMHQRRDERATDTWTFFTANKVLFPFLVLYTNVYARGAPNAPASKQHLAIIRPFAYSNEIFAIFTLSSCALLYPHTGRPLIFLQPPPALVHSNHATRSKQLCVCFFLYEPACMAITKLHFLSHTLCPHLCVLSFSWFFFIFMTLTVESNDIIYRKTCRVFIIEPQ